MKADAHARHECVNGLFKNYAILERRFRHNKQYHGLIFRACANLVQAAIQKESSVHQVEYYDK